MIGSWTAPDDALSDVRQAAIASFDGLPDRKVEEWKYTAGATRKLDKAGLALASDATGSPAAIRIEGADRIDVVNGFSSSAVSLDDSRVTKHLGTVATVTGPEHAFTTLNTGFLGNVVVIELSGQQTVHVAHSSVGTDLASHPRILIIAKAHSEGTVIETFEGDGGLCNAVTEIVLDDGAQLSHHLWQLGGGTKIGRVAVKQGRDSVFRSFAAFLGGSVVRNDLEISLSGPGAECFADGLYVLGGNEHCDNHTRIDHHVHHGTSHELYRGVLGGKSRAVFDGLIVVHPDAVKSDGELANHNLLLSDHARVDTKPELLIYNDDVKAAHGTTVGQLDAEALYYLRTRGVPKAEAERMLVDGFVTDLLARVPESLRGQLADRVRARLEAL